MPFVPLGSRKRYEVILDGDKEVIARKQQQRDSATIQKHVGAAPGSSGYRFANHPMTKGQVRGPDVPFSGATSTWKPPEADMHGPSARKDKTHQDYGAVWEASHSFRKVRSSPQLAAGTNLMEACHPLSTELRRWQTMARHTIQREMADIEMPAKQPAKPAPPPRKIPQQQQGLVNFPKYMLIHNCHLKTWDLQRFQKEQEEKARMEEELAREMEMSGEFKPPGGSPDPMGTMSESTGYQDASWGAPLRRLSVNGGIDQELFAGSALPSGCGQRTSNPFRMG